GFRMGNQDVFLNIAGGLKVEDPALDLAVCVSLISSFEDKLIPAEMCFAGEVGLGGEIRAVNRIEQRISEAEKLGFKHIFISRLNAKGIDAKKYNLQIHTVGKLSEVFDNLL